MLKENKKLYILLEICNAYNYEIEFSNGEIYLKMDGEIYETFYSTYEALSAWLPTLKELQEKNSSYNWEEQIKFIEELELENRINK